MDESYVSADEGLTIAFEKFLAHFQGIPTVDSTPFVPPQPPTPPEVKNG
jgi:hypothetical protein